MINKTLEEVTAALLETTADRFESGEYGWAQGAMRQNRNKNPSYCAIGGLYATSDRKIFHDQAVGAAMDAMIPNLPSWMKLAVPGEVGAGVMVATFNDRVAKDVSEVIEVMKLAAKDLRNGVPVSVDPQTAQDVQDAMDLEDVLDDTLNRS